MSAEHGESLRISAPGEMHIDYLRLLPIILGMNFRPLLLIVCSLPLCAQQQPSDNSQPKPTASVSATTRLLNAKTVYIKQLTGDEMVYEMVNNAIVGWPRYTVVDSPDKADLLIEVASPAVQKKDDSNKTSLQGGSSGRDPRTPQVPTTTYSDPDVKLFVRDAHTRAVLWSGREPAKEAFKQAKTDQNLMDATEKLLNKFHERVEPAPADSPK